MVTSIGKRFVMPERLPDDPDPDMLRIYRKGNDHLVVELGDGHSLILSEYNAARVCGLLSMFLNLRFVASDGKRLMLGPASKRTAKRKPGKTFTVEAPGSKIKEEDY